MTPILEQHMQLVSIIAQMIEATPMKLVSVEDTGNAVVYHLTYATDEERDAAHETFVAIEQLVQHENLNNTEELEIQIRLVGRSEEVAATN